MWILLSLFVIGTVSGELFNIKIQDDGSAFSTAGNDIPLTGFIRAKVASQQIALHVQKRVNLPPTCVQIELLDLPNPNSSPLMGDSLFTIVPDSLIHDHFHWSNGKDQLFFVKHAHGGNGNWLIGATAGEDSGYVYIEGPGYSKSPLGLESSSPWKWLLSGKWVDQPQLSAVCRDEGGTLSSFYEAEVFNPATGAATSTFFYLNSETSGFMFNHESQRWSYMSAITPLVGLGEAVNLQLPSGGAKQLAAVVNAEHAAEGGWRLTFRQLPHRKHVEYSVVLSPSGQFKDYGVSSLTSTQRFMHQRRLIADLQSVQPGDYVWLWHQHEANSEPQSTWSELLVECIARSNGVPGTLVFRGFPSHRVELMSQSVLSQNIDLITIKLLSEDHMEASFPDEPLAIHNLVVIGKQLEEFIWDFIFYKEKELAAVPACFMYHAAVSIPQSLVYAGELMCLLAGGKPLVMVQYTSPSDHQWKFPLVQKLTRGIVAAKEVLGDRLDIGYTVFSYGSEETLVLYRSSRKHLMESLRPHREAQALHLLPYVDRARGDVEEQWREQVYNAAWNGHVLGYPSRFVASYCDDFPNDLPLEEKRRVFDQAKRNFAEHVRIQGVEAPAIRLGHDQPVDAEARKILFESL